MNFVAAVTGFLIGILFSIYIGVSIPALFFTVFTTCFVGLVAFGTKQRIPVFILLLLLGFLLSSLRVSLITPEPPYVGDAGAQVALEGVVSSEIDVRESQARFVLTTSNPRTHILVSADRFTEVSFGSNVRVSGVLKEPESFVTDTGRIFEYQNYLAKDSVYYTISFANVEVFDSSLSLRGPLFKLKQWYLSGLAASLPEPHASLAGGITVGAKRSLGEVLLEAFRLTGLIHIVVLSGYNVTIVAEAIMRILGTFPKRISLGIGIFAIVSFVLMTGAGATIVRAGIMAVIALIARATHKTYALTRALFVAGIIMLLHNPLLLTYDPSFQLSFIATLGLVYVAPQIERVIKFVPKNFGLREIIGATIGTQIAVLSFILYLTGTLSLSALPVNILVLPVVPLAMGFSFIAGVFGAFSQGVGMAMGYPAYLLLEYVFTVVSFFEAAPLTAIEVPPFPFWVTAVLYGTLILILYYATSSKRFSTTDQFTFPR